MTNYGTFFAPLADVFEEVISRCWLLRFWLQSCALITDKQTNITGQRRFYCSLRKNIFQFSWDFYELVSEGIITIICCHWDGMRWEHCDCNGQFWDGTGWDLDLISRIFTSLQPHLRHSGVLEDENRCRFVSDFSRKSLEEIAYKLKENCFGRL